MQDLLYKDFDAREAERKRIEDQLKESATKALAALKTSE